MKRRGQRSPDVADSFVLTFAGAGAIAAGQQSRWNDKTLLKRDMGWVV